MPKEMSQRIILLANLAVAERKVALAKEQLRNYEALIARLEKNGGDISQAKPALQSFHEAHQAHQQDRAMLLNDLSELAWLQAASAQPSRRVIGPRTTLSPRQAA
jgi:hypothetical protein